MHAQTMHDDFADHDINHDYIYLDHESALKERNHILSSFLFKNLFIRALLFKTFSLFKGRLHFFHPS
jgi:hypothetical protein